jgi:tetratricopeptide (TPR) repeat protein
MFVRSLVSLLLSTACLSPAVVAASRANPATASPADGSNTAVNAAANRADTKVISLFKQACAIDPTFGEAYYNLGLLNQTRPALTPLADRTDPDDKTIALLKQACAADPKFIDAHYNLGLLYQKQNNLADAIACFQHALLIDPTDSSVRYQLGIALERAGQHGAAHAQFALVTPQAPEYADAHNHVKALEQPSVNSSGTHTGVYRQFRPDSKNPSLP